VLDAFAVEKTSVRQVTLAVLAEEGAEPWDTDGGPRSKARRRIEKAKALRDGGFRAFLEPGMKRRRRTRRTDAGEA